MDLEISFLRISFLLILLSPIAACDDSRSFEARGRVAGFGDEAHTLIVEHEDIPGLMPAMTMPFAVRDTSQVGELSTRDAIAFILTISGDSSWIHDIRLLPDTAVAEHPASSRDESYPQEFAPEILERGDPVPQTVLETHADTTLHLDELRGKAVLLTFIYTRCPMPDFCPLMSRKFAQLQPRVSERFGDQVHLLSVSIDPRHDAPEVLRKYADRYTENLSNWTFATADSAAIRTFANRFGEFYSSGSDDVIHNLVTVLVGTDGTVRKYWRGSGWTVDQITAALEELNRQP